MHSESMNAEAERRAKSKSLSAERAIRAGGMRGNPASDFSIDGSSVNTFEVLTVCDRKSIVVNQNRQDAEG